MKNYKLLTPGPLTTTDTVKREMLFDHCTWDDEYMQITQNIRKGLLELAHCSDKYTCVLMQGSGTFGVESVLSSVVGENDKLLICSNGAYGLRMCDMAKHNKIKYINYDETFDKSPNPMEIKKILEENKDITHVSMVHSETTSGILNDIASVAKVVKEAGKIFIVDAMSSFGGVDIDVEGLDIDFIISSANKCIQGVPGFSFIICKREVLEQCAGKARSLSLDLYDQWKGMDKTGKWRYTSPTHVVLAFAKAMEELKEEGGICAREKRYRDNNKLLIDGMKEMGFTPYIKKEWQSPIITTFFYPENVTIVFKDFYNYIKERGYAIYPGKLTEGETFRIGNIGEIYKEDIKKLLDIIKAYMMENSMKKKIQAVIFDWAGTTVDFGSFAPVSAFIEAFKEFGVEPTVKEVREPMGMLKWNHIEAMMKMPRIKALWNEIYGKEFTKEDVDRVYKASETSIMKILKDYANPKPYVLDAVKALRKRNIKIGSTTGYTDEMMSIVAPKAKENGYEPDFWCSPNSVNNMGRPYPYMIFKNFEALNLKDVKSVIKVGDTIADIKEGKNAGLISVGVIEGSSIMALSEEEFNNLDEEEKEKEYKKVTEVYLNNGADYVIKNMSELIKLIDELEK